MRIRRGSRKGITEFRVDTTAKTGSTNPNCAITVSNHGEVDWTGNWENYLEVTLLPGDLQLLLEYKKLGTLEELTKMKLDYEYIKRTLKRIFDR